MRKVVIPGLICFLLPSGVQTPDWLLGCGSGDCAGGHGAAWSGERGHTGYASPWDTGLPPVPLEENIDMTNLIRFGHILLTNIPFLEKNLSSEYTDLEEEL